MCGIVGLFAKTSEIENNLGRHLARMLVEMQDRGPDSAGFAVYRAPVSAGSVKLSLAGPEDTDWDALAGQLESAFGRAELTRVGPQACVVLPTDVATARAWLARHAPQLTLRSAGTSIEIYKDKGLPQDVAARFQLDGFAGSHAVGHTRMATESAVTTDHSHPFSTGLDLCLVHNGSLSNHNRLRQQLRHDGVEIMTDNDSEVAAGFLTRQLAQGDSLRLALESARRVLDGFYTFCVGTSDGFAVLRDPIACKHAVLAETDDWVAMATEFRAIAALPGAEAARVWEPAPGRVYIWHRDASGRVVAEDAGAEARSA
jgi:glutamate synthase domain-containing protein 1